MKSTTIILSAALLAASSVFTSAGAADQLQFQLSVQPGDMEPLNYQLNTTMGVAAVLESNTRVPYLKSCMTQADGNIATTMDDVQTGLTSKISPIRIEGDVLVAEVDVAYVQLLQMKKSRAQVGGGCILGEPFLKTMRASGQVVLKRGESVQLFKGERDPKQGGITVKVL